jgi:hypothetical protein
VCCGATRALPNFSLKRTRREASLVYACIPAARRLASSFGVVDKPASTRSPYCGKLWHIL